MLYSKLLLLYKALNQSVTHHHVGDCEPENSKNTDSGTDILSKLQHEWQLPFKEVQLKVRILQLCTHYSL